MDAFFQENKSFVFSTFFLAFGIAVLMYSLGYTGLIAQSADLAAASAFVSEDSKTTEAKIKDQESSDEETDIAIRSIPDFLRRINRIAQDTTVIIRKLVPDTEDKLKYNIEIFVDYYSFLRFASRLETLNVNIHDLEVRPFNAAKTPPVHFITFSITPKNDAESLAGNRLSRLRKMVTEKDKRNPFQRFAPYPKKDGKPQFAIDLTWVHRLGLVSRIAGQPVATIDGNDYKVDSIFSSVEGELKVSQISGRKVEMLKKTKDGVQKYFIGFQRKSKKGRKRKRK